jgi:hypothetical protein
MSKPSRVGNIEVYENTYGEVVIKDQNFEWSAVVFDECMAEKLCKLVMEVAQKIREGR